MPIIKSAGVLHFVSELKLVEFALRYCQVLIELAKPRQIAGGQLQHARGRDQSGLGLQEIVVCRW